MREYRSVAARELAACTCDRCQRRLTPEDPGEWQERLSVDLPCGFDSIFGDGNVVRLDLCQHCVRDLLGEWLRIEVPEHSQDAEKFAQALVNMPNVGKDEDFERRQE
ncbi:hypothetical protein N5I84_08590 [Ralstonia sp. CHL-2022]|uniref:Uncharacterized protein n=1 Tax=Ralstonia wenshanensis TaxID=2842456 RepID=A0AAD2EJS1_9RALS|nr:MULTISPECIES: hypothetical protein [Ralstonia]MCT7296218.1 hypothetical protein [Ralstonia mojiangensis]CAJ0683652.1 hypothetical protein LMG18091_00023 [Ralstonia wenshanensis]